MTTRVEALKTAQGLNTAHDLGMQVANEAIFRGLLLAIKQVAGANGPAMIEAIKQSANLSISNVKLDNPQSTAVFNKAADFVIDSVFDGLDKP